MSKEMRKYIDDFNNFLTENSKKKLNISDVSDSEKLNKAEELLQGLVLLSTSPDLEEVFNNPYIKTYMVEIENFLDGI
jgi:hypothetical protein